jgi:hypothetical protein
MTPLFKKLNFKDHSPVIILNAPASFDTEMQAMQPFAQMQTHFSPGEKGVFVLAFALTQAEVDAIAVQMKEKTSGDAIVWIAYPKGSSKRYKCDFNRDTGWEIMGKMGFEPVRQVAIDEDWSALRFRRVEFITEMTRSFALTEAGKTKVKSAPAPVPSMPADLAEALRNAPQALAFFEQLAPTHRKEYILWIEEAKKPETRQNRVVKAVEMLVAGKKST